uniref:DoxX family protein n=1 Tax=Acinetobacter stercoris TaxID=2126983 RepID=UPI0011B1C7DA
LRIICGLFLLPEAFGKFSVFPHLNPTIVDFFAKVGFHPAEIWVYFAALGELGCGVALILGICTRYAAIGAAIILLVACIALNIVRGHFAWTWSQGGDEYLIFWIICCVIVAIYEFQQVSKKDAN